MMAIEPKTPNYLTKGYHLPGLEMLTTDSISVMQISFHATTYIRSEQRKVCLGT